MVKPKPIIDSAVRCTAINVRSAEGDAANSASDRYGAAAALLAMVLFIGGISPVLQNRRAQLALLILATALCLAGIIWVVGLPKATL